MEKSCNYEPLKDAIIDGIVNIWPVHQVAQFFRNKAAEWDFQVDTMNSRRRTALDLLVCKTRSERDNEVIKLLLELGADPLWKDYDEKTTLCRLMRRNEDTELMIRCLDKIEDINVTLDAVGVNALYMAVDKENVTLLLYLVRRNLIVNITSLRGRSPLHEAVTSKNLSISWILLKHGADVNIKDVDGETPIFAALEGNDSIEQIDMLLRHGADLKATDNAGRTPLHALCANEFGINIDILKLLLDYGADPNAADSMGRTPLEGCIRNDATYMDDQNSLMVAELLIEYGASVNARNSFDQTLLHVAARSGPCTFVKYLIHKGADTNAVDGQGMTFLELLKPRGPCWRKVLQILVLKHFGKSHLGLNLERLISANVEFHQFVFRARLELTIFSDRHTEDFCPSRLDLMTSDEKRATRLCENVDLRSALSRTNFAIYPIYGKRLRVKYEEGCRRARAEAAAKDFFFEISKGRLHSYAAGDIIQFIPTECLMNLEVVYQDMAKRK
ncbi:transient receptor potential channel pyrexia-like [Coccinella septempunctata]|uniref:transient receptor potential channel pyrexia-like n=1 Tax=Coccinella septempunctata TaxID=41139 RepID=UPI001D086685|nr:transient receptor potential channel pyrexia-like [Coccinella septempunctata]